MKLNLDPIFAYLWPESKLYATPWESLWKNVHSLQVNAVATRLLIGLIPVMGILIITDKAANLQPFELFLQCRLLLLGWTVICALMSVTKTVRNAHLGSTVLVLLYALVVALAEAYLITIGPAIPFYFCVLIASAALLFMRLNPTLAALYFNGVSFACLAIVEPTIHQTSKYGENLSLIIVVALFVLLFARSKGQTIDLFISNSNVDFLRLKLDKERQEHIQEMRGTLSKRLIERFDFLMYARKYPIPQAMNAVIHEIDKENVAVFYTDIRGFTEATKNVHGKRNKEIKIILKESTDIVQDFWGISKPVGDLILSYYDEDDGESNIVNSLSSAFSSQAYTAQRAKQSGSDAVRRFYLLSFGPASVGNMGGTEYAREITVLGVPCNVLARLDLLTKEPALNEKLGNDTMIATRSYRDELVKLYPTLSIREIDLNTIGLEIKNFPKENLIYVIENNVHNEEIFKNEILVDAKKIASVSKFYLEKMYPG